MCFLDDEDDTTPDCRGFSISHEKQIVMDLLKYTKELICEEVKLLDEEAVEECLNVGNDAAVALQLSGSVIVDNIMHCDRGSNTDDDDNKVENEEEKISVDKCISLTEELIHGLGQTNFITQQHVVRVYKIQMRFCKKKSLNI
jgi:hypothetical protein